MGKFDFLSVQVRKKQNDYTVYKCPLCGSDNKMNSRECIHCMYSLTEYESIYFSRFNKYNEAIEHVRNHEYIKALETIISYLEFYNNDIDAIRLHMFILYLMNAPDFVERAEECMNKYDDRLLARLVDEPDTISIDDFCKKPCYEGSVQSVDYGQLASVQVHERLKAAFDRIDIINRLYALYINVRKKKKYTKIDEEFMLFYDKVFMEYMSHHEMNILDYLGRNYNEFTEEQQSQIGKVDQIENRKLPNGQIVSVFLPEIRYHSLVIQRAQLTININHDKKKK